MGAQFCPHLDCELLASGAIREYISVGFSSLACGHSQQPQETGAPTLHAGHTSWLPHPTRPSLSHKPPSPGTALNPSHSNHVPQNPLQPTPFQRGGKVRLRARQRSPDHTQQAMVGGSNLNPCIHSTALPRPPTPPSLASQGAELSFPGKGRAGWEVHVGAPLGAKPWLSGQGSSAGIVDSSLVVPGTSKKWGCPV